MSDASVLVVDDEELYARAIGRELERRGVRCDLAFTCREALRRAERGRYQAILLDHRLPDDDGIRIIPILRARQPGAAVVMMTAYQTIPNAVEAIRRGAEDYVVKETSLQPIIDRVLEIRRRAELRGAGRGEPSPEGLLGRSGAMVRVLEEIRQLAASPDTTVLITGETGTGKEVAARHLHALSRPAGSPFVAIDCLALPGTLAESLLFGHEKGAFTDAAETRAGAFEDARDGTVFLDEIGDMSELQGKLLRVLEGRSFHRLGSSREQPLRARVVAATNQDLPEAVRQGRFRRDLYERISVFPLQIPPLRERGDDVLLLANHFARYFADKLGRKLEPLGGPVVERLMDYDYPGNVRELRNIIERAVIVAEEGRVELRHLPQRLLAARSATGEREAMPADFVPGVDTLGSLEEKMIRQALQRAHNVRAEAARLLGISRYQLLRRLEKYNIQQDGASAGPTSPGGETGR
jgi:DNA-binding NtrC family response regulator